MSVAPSRLTLVIVSLLVSAGLWFLGVSQIPAGGRYNYALLVCGEAVPDREITERLESRGITGFISESRQWVFLDCFDGIERIPLDEYKTRLLPFDPRNDGYADKLRSLFVRNGKRFVYIPAGSAVPVLNNKLSAAMEGVPYSFERAGNGAAGGYSTGLLLALFCFSSCAFFIIRPLGPVLRANTAGFISCLSLLSPLSLGGAAGFALAAMLAGFAVFLSRPQADRFALPYRKGLSRRLLPPIFIICYCLIAFFSGLPILFSLSVLASYCCIFAFSLRSLSRFNPDTLDAAGLTAPAFAKNNAKLPKKPLVGRRIPGHQRFIPVEILSRRTFNIGFSWAMIPYAAVAVVLACIGISVQETSPADFSFLPPGQTLSEEDYQNHFLFQSTFSQRPLYSDRPRDVSMAFDTDNSLPGMGDYRLASDGLPEPIPGSGFFEESPPDNFVPFPLNDLLRDLEKRSGRVENGGIPGRGAVHEIPLSLIPLLFIIPCLIIGIFSGNLKHKPDESLFVSAGGTFLRRPHRSS